MGNRWGLKSIEVDALIALCMFHWTHEDRERIASNLPKVYSKLTNTEVTVKVYKDETDILVITAERK